jgi:hypothetical protein
MEFNWKNRTGMYIAWAHAAHVQASQRYEGRCGERRFVQKIRTWHSERAQITKHERRNMSALVTTQPIRVLKHAEDWNVADLTSFASEGSRFSLRPSLEDLVAPLAEAQRE